MDITELFEDPEIDRRLDEVADSTKNHVGEVAAVAGARARASGVLLPHGGRRRTVGGTMVRLRVRLQRRLARVLRGWS